MIHKYDSYIYIEDRQSFMLHKLCTIYVQFKYGTEHSFYLLFSTSILIEKLISTELILKKDYTYANRAYASETHVLRGKICVTPPVFR